MNLKPKMRYSVEYDGVLTTIYEDITGEFETLEEAKKAAIRHLQIMIEMAEYQISHIKSMKENLRG